MLFVRLWIYHRYLKKESQLSFKNYCLNQNSHRWAFDGYYRLAGWVMFCQNYKLLSRLNRTLVGILKEIFLNTQCKHWMPQFVCTMNMMQNLSCFMRRCVMIWAK